MLPSVTLNRDLLELEKKVLTNSLDLRVSVVGSWFPVNSSSSPYCEQHATFCQQDLYKSHGAYCWDINVNQAKWQRQGN